MKMFALVDVNPVMYHSAIKLNLFDFNIIRSFAIRNQRTAAVGIPIIPTIYYSIFTIYLHYSKITKKLKNQVLF